MRTIKIIATFNADCYNNSSKEICDYLSKEMGAALANIFKNTASYINTTVQVIEEVVADTALLKNEED